MKKIIILFVLCLNSLFAQINEYKVDLYYSTNIILKGDKKDEDEIWQNQILNLLAQYPEALDKVGNINVAFHESDEWLGNKIAELQTLEGFEAFGSWQGFRLSIAAALGKLIAMPVGIVGGGLLEFWRSDIVLKLHDDTIIKEQYEAYINSIHSGRGVVVVSHGFGNTFTAKMFDKLGEEGEGNNIGWMQNYFHEIAVAPSESTVANNIYSVAFDNDLIWYEYPIQNYMAHYRILTNPNRRDVFVKVDDEYGEIYSDNGEYGEIALDLKSAQYHKFAYYLGYPVYEEALIDESNTTTEVKLRQTNLAKDSIQSSIHYEIIKHQERESQWQYDTNSSNSKVFLKHRYDDSLKLYGLTGEDSEVYPFNMSTGKVYRLDDNITYVKASYGGTQIDSNWTGQELNELYRLNNYEEEKILSDRFKFNSEDNLTIIDTQTYLLWDNSIYDANWIDANSYCQGLVSDSYDNWRMPDFYELKSIGNPTTNNHVYEEFFTALASHPYGYWSSTTFTYYDAVWTWWGGYQYVQVTDSLVLNYSNASNIWIDTKYDMNFMCVQQL